MQGFHPFNVAIFTLYSLDLIYLNYLLCGTYSSRVSFVNPLEGSFLLVIGLAFSLFSSSLWSLLIVVPFLIKIPVFPFYYWREGACCESGLLLFFRGYFYFAPQMITVYFIQAFFDFYYCIFTPYFYALY